MKLPLVALTCLTLVSSGCFLVPSPYSKQLNPAVKRYRSISAGVSRAEVEAQFGKPTRSDGDASFWEVRFDDVNYAMAKVWFGTDDKALKVEITHAHGVVVPGHSARATTTWEK